MRFNKEGIYLILIIIITSIAYINIVQNEFVWDDNSFIVEWYETRSLKNTPLFFKGNLPHEHGGVYRPIRSIFYALSYKLWKSNPPGYHFQSILIHLTCTILIYFITLQITNKNGIAFMSSLIFGVHPVHTESITLIVASFDIIGAIFFFASFYLYLKASNKNKARLYYSFSIVFAVLAFFSYEFALTLPLIIVLYDICFKKIKMDMIGKIKVYAYYFVGALFYLSIRFFILNIGSRGSYLAGSFYLTMLTMSKAFIKYILLVILPIKLSVNHTISKGILSLIYLDLNKEAIVAQSIFDLHILFSIAVIIALLIIALRSSRRYPLISFCIGWFFIGLLPMSNIIPQGSLLCEKYLYISSFAFCLLFSFVFYSIYSLVQKKDKGGYIKILLILFFIFIILFYTAVTHSRNKDFKNSLILWSKTAEQAPNSVIAHDNLGMAYHRNNQVDRAINEFKMALAIKPDHHKAHNNLGASYFKKGEIDLAIEEYKIAIAIKPNNAKAPNNLGAAYYKKGEIELAIEEYKKAIGINPNYINARLNLANLYYLLGEMDMAIAEYEEILAINPDDARARRNLKKAIEKKGKEES